MVSEHREHKNYFMPYSIMLRNGVTGEVVPVDFHGYTVLKGKQCQQFPVVSYDVI